MADDLLTIPNNIGRAIVETGAVVACPLLGTEKFIEFCKQRGLSINRERLFGFERLRLFAPVFRVLTPEGDAEPLSIPPREGNNWFSRGWAWDTTSVEQSYEVPELADRTQEGYYSPFQIDHLQIVLGGMTLSVQLDGYLEESASEIDWNKNGKRWLDFAHAEANSLRSHEYRRAVGFLCQFISNRYYPQTQGNQRTIQVPQGLHSSDFWTTVSAFEWKWDEIVRRWAPHEVERLFGLTPAKLSHAYRGLAISQAHCDPLERWYPLLQFVNVQQRHHLKGNALRAETLRSGAFMLRALYTHLYGEELPHPNEVMGKVITHVPELEVRKDTRRHLEFVANRFGLNPQPTLSLIVEGSSEEQAVLAIFDHHFGAHPGKFGIEIVVLGGVDAATGTKEDRFRAIVRLIDYLHHHQTFTFLILDNERYARKLKVEAKKATSIHSRRYVTRPEYLKVWKISFEFDNFSCTEIASVLTGMAGGKGRFVSKEIDACRKTLNPGAELKDLYLRRAGKKLDKLKLSMLLTDRMLSPAQRRKIVNRPIVQTLQRIAHLAARNYFPAMQSVWEMNQASKYFGKKRR